MECNELNITEILVQLDVTVGRFLQNCSHTFQSEVNFQAKRFKLLMIKNSVFSVYSEIMERKRKIACLLLALAGEEFFQSQKKRRVRRFYVRKSNTSRSTKGDFNSLVHETQRLNDPSFEAIFHMTKTVFADLLQLVAPNLNPDPVGSFIQDPDPSTHIFLDPELLNQIGDEAFTLRKDVMRPYPGSALDKNQRIFNYRLSRARRPQNIEKIVAAACCLHNYCMAMSKNLYSPEGFVDSEDSTGHIQQGSWHETAAFPDLLPSGSRSTEYARQNAGK
uniref:DDE Tnp4 domain-containing protein n=1 Tax=Romanomermis culicivorax TaxID=13658 RepID=A0A915JPJ3_ROMCU